MIGHRVIMEESMPRPRPPHLQREVTRHGTVVWYVRIGKGPRVRIKAQFGTPEFDAEYQNAATGKPRVPTTKTAPVGSLAWLLAGYREVRDWTHLSLATRRQRENIFSHVLAQAGHVPANKITQASIVAGLERRSETPAQARNFLDAMRGLFKWAVKRGLAKIDPTAGVQTPTRKTGPGFVMWTEEQMAAYERRWPIAPRNASGLMCSPIPACAAAMRCAWAAPCARWRRHHHHRKVGLHGQGDFADTAGARPHAEEGTVRRHHVHCGRERPPLDRRILRQSVSPSLPQSRRARLGAWRAQDRRHPRG